MSVHYKFKSALEYDTVTFDGLHISVKDLKKAIIHQKRIGKNTDFDLQVTNAQTKEVYNDENALIPKNTSLIIARIPMVAQTKGKPWEGYGNSGTPAAAPVRPEDGGFSKAVDLTQLDASEDDKIRAMMTQSTLDYDPSNYMKIRGSNQVGVVPSHYRCFKCHQPGHWIKDCPLGHGQEPMEIKKSTGIPRSFMVPVEGPMVPGAMMTPTGQYAVPVLDHQAYTEGTKPNSGPSQEEKPEIPEDLVCSICKDLLTDAVMIPCCGNSFCDECIRTTLLESEDHECPDCHEKEISPGTLIPNRFLRNSVSNFKNETGYHKRITYRNAVTQQKAQEENHVDNKESGLYVAESTTEGQLKQEEVAPDSQTDEQNRNGDSQKPVISEADSTETSKAAIVKEEIQQEKSSKHDPSNTTSSKSPQYKAQPITSVGSQVNHHRSSHHSHSRLQSAGVEPRGLLIPSQYGEERPGTPTVDEPGMGPPGETFSNRGTALPPMHQNVMGPNQGPPGQPPFTTLPPGMGSQPPPGVFPPPSIPSAPGYRLPPPGHPDYNRLTLVSGVDPSVPPPHLPPATVQGYGPPPRQIFDPTRPPVPFDPHRPPIHGPPPPGFPPYTGGVRPRGGAFPPPRHLQPPPPGMNHRGHNPPGLIDDPLEAFNRMLREKDERDRRARQARRGSRSRSYSRSRSRTRSRSFSRSPRRRTRSPTPPRRRSRTRSPPLRRRRTRSRSFSISRSRSISRSPSFRGSPPREFSPRRRPPSRYRSPLPRSSPPPRYNRYKDRPLDRHSRDRDIDRPPRDRLPDRDFQYYPDGPDYDYEYDRGRRTGAPPRSRYPPRKEYPPQTNDQFYQPPEAHPPGYNSRYNSSRGPQSYPPPLMSVKTNPPERPEVVPPRRYDDMGPPGLEQPPPPGFENTRYDTRYPYDRTRDDGPPGVDKFNKNSPNDREETERPRDIERPRDLERPREIDRPREERPNDRPRDLERRDDRREPERRAKSRERKSRERNVDRDRRYSPSPERHRSASPKRHTSRDRYPDKSRKKHESSDRDKRDRGDSDREKKDKKKDRDLSEEDKIKKSKEKKKKKAEKKEAERKRKKERKEKKEQEKIKKAEERKAKEIASEQDKSENKYEDSETKLEENKEQIHKELIIKDIEVTEKDKQNDLYDDIPTEGIDNNIVAKYGKIDQDSSEKTPKKEELKENKSDDEEKDTSFDGIELQVSDAELKSDFIDIKPKSGEVLAPVPEVSKWERDDELYSEKSDKSDSKQIFDRPSKVVTSEVLKRAENAIFAKAINAIRPIEIKKISLDRAKLYSGEKGSEGSKDKEMIKNIQVTIPGPAWEQEVDIAPPGTEPIKIKERKTPPPNRLSVKERLGCKVEELDRLTKDERFERNRSRTLSPLSRRQDDINRGQGLGDRRVELDDRRREDYRRNDRRHDRDRRDRRDRSRSREHKPNYRERFDRNRREERRERSHSKNRHIDRSHDRHRHRDEKREKDKERERKVEKISRTRSRSDSKEPKKKDSRKIKEKKHKRDTKEHEKSRRHKDDERGDSVKVESKIIVQERKSDEKEPERAKIQEDRRKPTLDEANFEPDYDLESESEKEDSKTKSDKKRDRSKSVDAEKTIKKKKTEDDKEHKKPHSSSSESSDSSDEDKHKKKHRKHKKKKSKKDTSSSSSDSDSDSSVEEKKKRKHKSKKQKKRKKSKHK